MTTTHTTISRLARVVADVGQSAMIERLSQTCPAQSMDRDVLVATLKRRVDEAMDLIESSTPDVTKVETIILIASRLAGIEAAGICEHLWERRN